MKRRGPRAAIVAVLLLGLLIFGGVYFTWTTVTDVFQPANSAQPHTVAFVIDNGESGAQIADALQTKGLIRNSLAFRIWARIKGLDTQLQAGAYNLSPNMTIDQIIAQLLHGQPDAIPVTIVEGWRIAQIADKFAHNDPAFPPLTKFNEQDFLNYTQHPTRFPDYAKYPVLKAIPAGNGMEGLLFPDTYLIPVNATARDVVNIMLTEFNDKVQQNHLDTLAKQNQLSVYQMVILASIVQREVRFEDDRPLVASVYWNRIYKPNAETVSMLDADPTVQYARDSASGTKTYWTPLNDSGRLITPNSAWNTYTHTGFPPTPICSPGLASLEAAASPAKTTHYFFLSKPDGHNVYADTNAEFQMDVQKYLHP
ncbi:MAG: endolytic transglycosylase MltG [Ktedonobacteraceae bacterium]